MKRRTKFGKKVKRFYNSAAWRGPRGLRLRILRRDNYQCRECAREGIVTPANEVHHLVRLGKDWDRRLDPNNCEAICPAHHKAHNVMEKMGNLHRKITAPPRLTEDGLPNPEFLAWQDARLIERSARLSGEPPSSQQQ